MYEESGLGAHAYLIFNHVVTVGNCGVSEMGHQNVWYSHPRKYGPGSRQWYVEVGRVVYRRGCGGY